MAQRIRQSGVAVVTFLHGNSAIQKLRPSMAHAVQDLDDREVHFKIEPFRDGFEMAFVDAVNGYMIGGNAKTFDKAVLWLVERAQDHRATMQRNRCHEEALMPNSQLEETIALDGRRDETRLKGVAPATEKAKAKAARLRLMKERNENYLAEREVDEDLAIELRVSDSN